ncbi:MAG: hypothetical protein H6834_08245 [Planctomycetes bacterium]|nr:hypothetical protein [Planctomycetota bacterium]
MSLHRGQQELRRYLDAQEPKVASLDIDGFRAWLGRRLEVESRDPGFQLRTRIQEIESRPEFVAARKAYRQAERALAQTTEGQRMRSLLAEIESGEKAIEGLRGALANGAGAPQRTKLDQFEDQVDTAHRALRHLHRTSQAFQQYESAREHLERLEQDSGLRDAEQALVQHQKHRGRRAGNQGDDFERLALEVLRETVVPELTRQGETLHVLSGVTLGCARAELDHVIVREYARRSVDVRAIVEVKRNVNDVASGFRMRQENIAWFRGAHEGYDPVLYRTQRYQHGHFDREAVHEAPDGHSFVFDRRSFQRFKPDDRKGHYLKHLYFFCDRRPLLGIGASEYSKLTYRIQTMPEFDLADDRTLTQVFHWLCEMAPAIQTRDVLEWYARRKPLATQILLWDRHASTTEPEPSR